MGNKLKHSKINLVKLCVGVKTVFELEQWQKYQLSDNKLRNKQQKIIHVTRMWPKRKLELLSGGSIYWVFKGLILARQEILDLEEIVTSDNIKRCGLVLNQKIFKTKPKQKRAFQGWRYLTPEQAPSDEGQYSAEEEELPHTLQLELSRLGVR